MWHNDQLARIESRAPTAAVTNYLIDKLGLNRLLALGITNELDNIFAVSGAMAPERKPYQVWHKAVSYLEPAGKPINKCRMLDVVLTLVDPSDAAPDISSRERSRIRILRICKEAIHQGAVLSYEDISLLLGLERTTVGKYIQELKKEGYPELTRADVTKSSRNQTHKRIIIMMYLTGVSELEIVRRTKHSLPRVNEYLNTFVRVVLALYNGIDQQLLPKVCKMSSRLVEQYLQIYTEVQADEGMRKKLQDWISRLEAPKKGGPQ